MNAAWFRRVSENEAHVWWPYNEELIQEFKDLIPWTFRKWDKDTKAWIVTGYLYCNLAHGWYRRHFDGDYHQASWDDPFTGQHQRQSPPPPNPPPPPPKPPPPPSTSSDWDVLYLRRGAPAGLIDAVYRWWAKKEHPDLGGNPETMKTINAAYDRLKQVAR